MTQRYEHKSTEPLEYGDPFVPQMEGWELVAVVPTYAIGQVVGSARNSSLDLKGRVLYWKRPVGNLEAPHGKR
jgi:hypothetical protein